MVENALHYASDAKIYIWKKKEKKDNLIKKRQITSPAQIYAPKLTKSKLKDLAWSLNIKEEVK
ncbi:MAG TPA: hypothetical protein ENH22_00400 [Candidatus Campbellbacteria bacterium]|nr:hypothetical protein [Candidatus Campbellbacteria bacterium]